jgi:hypothetical protein
MLDHHDRGISHEFMDLYNTVIWKTTSASLKIFPEVTGKMSRHVDKTRWWTTNYVQELSLLPNTDDDKLFPAVVVGPENDHRMHLSYNSPQNSSFLPAQGQIEQVHWDWTHYRGVCPQTSDLPWCVSVNIWGHGLGVSVIS